MGGAPVSASLPAFGGLLFLSSSSPRRWIRPPPLGRRVTACHGRSARHGTDCASVSPLLGAARGTPGESVGSASICVSKGCLWVLEAFGGPGGHPWVLKGICGSQGGPWLQRTSVGPRDVCGSWRCLEVPRDICGSKGHLWVPGVFVGPGDIRELWGCPWGVGASGGMYWGHLWIQGTTVCPGEHLWVQGTSMNCGDVHVDRVHLGVCPGGHLWVPGTSVTPGGHLWVPRTIHRCWGTSVAPG